MNILVTGGAGYIGSHMVWTLKENNYVPIVFDNLSSGHRESLPKDVPFIEGDLRKYGEVEKIFRQHRIEAVIHFAGSSIVSESAQNPTKYYENNILSSINLLRAMEFFGVKKIIFSSTAATYGIPQTIPIIERNSLEPINTYGRSKWMVEQILKDVCTEAKQISYVILRYFNASGAHKEAPIGESHDPETHLIPNLLKVALGKKKEFILYGNNYPTPDGTCIRDYIHVEDLCNAHLLSLQSLNNGMKNEIFNLGSGKGYSVKEIIKGAKKVSGCAIKVTVGARRACEPPILIASYEKAKRWLNWEPKFGLDEILGSAWNWEATHSKVEALA